MEARARQEPAQIPALAAAVALGMLLPQEQVVQAALPVEAVAGAAELLMAAPLATAAQAVAEKSGLSATHQCPKHPTQQ